MGTSQWFIKEERKQQCVLVKVNFFITNYKSVKSGRLQGPTKHGLDNDQKRKLGGMRH